MRAWRRNSLAAGWRSEKVEGSWGDGMVVEVLCLGAVWVGGGYGLGCVGDKSRWMKMDGMGGGMIGWGRLFWFDWSSCRYVRLHPDIAENVNLSLPSLPLCYHLLFPLVFPPPKSLKSLVLLSAHSQTMVERARSTLACQHLPGPTVAVCVVCYRAVQVASPELSRPVARRTPSILPKPQSPPIPHPPSSSSSDCSLPHFPIRDPTTTTTTTTTTSQETDCRPEPNQGQSKPTKPEHPPPLQARSRLESRSMPCSEALEWRAFRRQLSGPSSVRWRID